MLHTTNQTEGRNTMLEWIMVRTLWAVADMLEIVRDGLIVAASRFAR